MTTHPQTQSSRFLHSTMSRLNAGAFEFVPGKAFKSPSQQQQPPPPPIERPEQTQAPPPPPTISLNIGGAAPPAPVPAPAPVPVPALPTPAKATPQSSKPATPKPQTTIRAETAGASSKTFSSEKARTDTSTVAQDVKNAADQAILEDLYGDRMSIYSNHPCAADLIQFHSERASEHRFHWPCRCREEHDGWKHSLHDWNGR